MISIDFFNLDGIQMKFLAENHLIDSYDSV